MKQRSLIVAAALIVCATNAIALGFGWLNRRGVDDPGILLTERELPIASSGPESTATILRLQWVSRDDQGFPCDKIRPLGFRCSDPALEYQSRDHRQPSRNGVVVLEYDGPAWEEVRQRRDDQAAKFAAENPAATWNPWRENNQTHLIPVDVGNDAAALRREYPDSSRYLISAARISARPMPTADSKRTILRGFVDELLPSMINVPSPFSGTIERAERAHAGESPQSWAPAYTVRLRYGRFLEPWVVVVSPIR
jgi:hypothetical protein